jgi:hypothetical protein
MADLRDSGRFSLGFGIGLSVDAKVGPLTHPSLGISSAAAMVGSDSRDIYGVFLETRTSEPLATLWESQEGASFPSALNRSGWRAAFEAEAYETAFAAVSDPLRQERPDVLFPESDEVELAETLEIGRWLPIPPDVTYNSATDLQVGATALLFSIRTGVNPLELFDFLAGLLGLDPAGDDGD